MFNKTSVGNVNLLDPHELAANRRGEILTSQIQRLNAMLGWGQYFFEVIFVCIISLPPILIFFPILVRGQMDENTATIAIIGFIFIVFLIYILPGLWKRLNILVKLRRDQANIAVRQEQGQLVYGNKGYAFRTTNRSLLLPANGTGGLLPGITYRVYYLEETGFLLSAEEVYLPAPIQVDLAINQILASANNFSLEDLESNRNGKIMLAQRLKLLPRLIAIFLSICVATVVFLLFPISIHIYRQPVTNTLVLLILLIIGTVFIVFIVFTAINVLLDLFAASLDYTIGRGHKEMHVGRGNRRTTTYYYVIGKQRFEVGQRAYIAFINHLKYRVYYFPHTRVMLSIEALTIPIPSPD